MENIIDTLRSIPDYIGSNGRTEKIILEAELSLGVAFADDYRQYLEVIGLACFDGHELTGLTDIIRLDVISVTKEQRAINTNIVLLMLSKLGKPRYLCCAMTSAKGIAPAPFRQELQTAR